MIRAAGVALLAAIFGLAACEDGAAQADRQKALKFARAGMNRVRGLPGGKQASFTEVRLVGGDTVCGRIDGNDGFGARAFGTRDAAVLITDPRDPASKIAVSRLCEGRPAREITSRNPQFSDIDLAE